MICMQLRRDDNQRAKCYNDDQRACDDSKFISVISVDAQIQCSNALPHTAR